MVKVIGYEARKTREGEDFFVLILQGGIEIVQSQETGKNYVTARRTSIPSTFDEESCQNLVGEKLPGSIKKIPCEPYEYTIPKSGEVVTLEHHWEYTNEPATVSEVIHDGLVQSPSS